MSDTSRLEQKKLVFKSGPLTTDAVKAAVECETSNRIKFSGASSNDTVTLANIKDPIAGSEAATKAYVDNVAGPGLSFKNAVRLRIEATNISPADIKEGYQTQNITLAKDDRILINYTDDSGTSIKNGIYVVPASSTGGLTGDGNRAPDAAAGDPASASFVFVQSGTFADRGYVQHNDVNFGDSKASNAGGINFVDFSAATSITSGNNITVDPNDNSVNLNTTITSTAGGHTFSSQTEATNSTNGGALTVSGGMGIGKKLFVGTDLAVGGASTVTGQTTCAALTDSTNTGTGSLVVSGGVGVAKTLRVGQDLHVTQKSTLANAECTSTTTSTSTTTGALVVGGGVGIGLDCNIGGNMTAGKGEFSNEVKVTIETESQSSTTGAVIVSGGIGVAKAVSVGGQLTVSGDTTLGKVAVSSTADASSSTDATASIKTDGGVAIAKKLYVGGLMDVSGSGAFGGAVTIADPAGTDSASLTSGSFVTNGGMAVGKQLRVGTDLTVSNEAFAQAFIASSDRTLKQNITPIQPSDALKAVGAMAPCSYEFKTAPDDPRCGVIAQELAGIAPELVKTTSKGTLAVDYNDMSAYLIGAIQALQQQVDAQAAFIAEMKAKCPAAAAAAATKKA